MAKNANKKRTRKGGRPTGNGRNPQPKPVVETEEPKPEKKGFFSRIGTKIASTAKKVAVAPVKAVKKTAKTVWAAIRGIFVTAYESFRGAYDLVTEGRTFGRHSWRWAKRGVLAVALAIPVGIAAGWVAVAVDWVVVVAGTALNATLAFGIIGALAGLGGFILMSIAWAVTAYMVTFSFAAASKVYLHIVEGKLDDMDDDDPRRDAIIGRLDKLARMGEILAERACEAGWSPMGRAVYFLWKGLRSLFGFVFGAGVAAVRLVTETAKGVWGLIRHPRNILGMLGGFAVVYLFCGLFAVPALVLGAEIGFLAACGALALTILRVWAYLRVLGAILSLFGGAVRGAWCLRTMTPGEYWRHSRTSLSEKLANWVVAKVGGLEETLEEYKEMFEQGLNDGQAVRTCTFGESCDKFHDAVKAGGVVEDLKALYDGAFDAYNQLDVGDRTDKMREALSEMRGAIEDLNATATSDGVTMSSVSEDIVQAARECPGIDPYWRVIATRAPELLRVIEESAPELYDELERGLKMTDERLHKIVKLAETDGHAEVVVDTVRSRRDRDKRGVSNVLDLTLAPEGA